MTVTMKRPVGLSSKAGPDTTRLLLIASVSASLLFWLSVVVKQRIAKDVSAVQRASAEMRLPNAGLRIDLGAGFLRSASLPVSLTEPAATLVLVTSDECAACAKHLPGWVDALGGVKKKQALEVAVISVAGDSLPERLRVGLIAIGIHMRILHATEPSAMSFAFGVHVTPHALVLDRDRRVRASSSRLSPLLLQLLEDELQKGQKGGL